MKNTAQFLTICFGHQSRHQKQDKRKIIMSNIFEISANMNAVNVNVNFFSIKLAYFLK